MINIVSPLNRAEECISQLSPVEDYNSADVEEQVEGPSFGFILVAPLRSINVSSGHRRFLVFGAHAFVMAHRSLFKCL